MARNTTSTILIGDQDALPSGPPLKSLPSVPSPDPRTEGPDLRVKTKDIASL